MQIWIVWLPNVGKSTLFNALTKSSKAQAANYPFCTIDPNVWVVEVPDERMKEIVKVIVPQKIIPAVIEFVDIAWLVEWASKWEWLWNQFLSHIRECNAIAQVLRFFEDWNVIHVNNEIHPRKDKEIIEMELIIKDIDTIEKSLWKTRSDIKSGKPEAKIKLELLERLKSEMSSWKTAIKIKMGDDEKEILNELHLLTNKPILYIANVSEEWLKNFNKEKAREVLWLEVNDEIVPICAKLESELAEMSEEDSNEFLKEFWIKSSWRDELIRSAYKILNLETYFTAWVKEVRAWTIKKWSKAPQAAWVIHTDFERWFICADVIFWKDLVECWWETKAKEKWLLKMQGKEYVMKDWDICHFKFNV